MARLVGSIKMRNAYTFLKQAEKEGRIFSLEDLVKASGWTANTAQSIRSKKLGHIIDRVESGYQCSGISRYDEEAFCRLCSQTSSLADDPERPRLDPKVEGFVIKAREAALAAVQHYNNPTSVFRSGNYIVLMIIAYTSLFHAIFERYKVDYVEYGTDGKPRKTKDGENFFWDAERSANYYATHYQTDANKKQLVAMAKNLEFMIPIRNKIEHRFMPELDVTVVGHCQALLMNFEYLLVEEFTTYYALNTSLSLALQFSTQRSNESVNALKRFQSKEYEELQDYITQFHKNLPSEIYTNPAFVFRVWLIPKIGNHEKTSDLSIEYVHIDKLDPWNAAELEKSILAIRDKTVEVPKDPGQTHPYLRNQAYEQLKAKLGDGVKISIYDVQCIVNVYQIKKNPKYFFQGTVKHSPGQYSNSFLDWIVEQYTTNPNFFNETREKQKSNAKK
jgi:hypothetical protein